MERLSIVAELVRSILKRKKYFLAPLVLILLLMILLIVLGEVPALTPFIYSVF